MNHSAHISTSTVCLKFLFFLLWANMSQRLQLVLNTHTGRGHEGKLPLASELLENAERDKCMSVTVMSGARSRAHTHTHTHACLYGEHLDADRASSYVPASQVCVWFVCLTGQCQTWLFTLVPQIVLHSPATCHFVLKAQLLSC